ncbi:hypothetical protein [Streptosporangium sp. KLBMP 9127]|nr:hypothetical protein [Streptosporangium sp. KLBMP 9127]
MRQRSCAVLGGEGIVLPTFTELRDLAERLGRTDYDKAYGRGRKPSTELRL